MTPTCHPDFWVCTENARVLSRSLCAPVTPLTWGPLLRPLQTDCKITWTRLLLNLGLPHREKLISSSQQRRSFKLCEICYQSYQSMLISLWHFWNINCRLVPYHVSTPYSCPNMLKQTNAWSNLPSPIFAQHGLDILLCLCSITPETQTGCHSCENVRREWKHAPLLWKSLLQTMKWLGNLIGVCNTVALTFST